MIIFSPVKYIYNCLFKMFLETLVPSRKLRRCFKSCFAKHYLKKYVKKINKKEPNKNVKQFKMKEEIIWQFWHNGIENAPDIVKVCVQSIDKFEPNKKHIILTMDTLKDYIDIPQKYYRLLKCGRMGMAHFSDIVRSLLLLKYGGYWIDVTVLLTAPLPEYISRQDLFVFKDVVGDNLDGLNMTSYFIYSKPNNKLLKDVYTAVEYYWKDNNFLVNYFTWLHLFTMLSIQNKKDKEIFDKIPFVSFIPVQNFETIINKDFDKNMWDVLLQQTSIHKLSYKFKFLKQNKIVKDSFYDYLISGRLIKGIGKNEKN